MGNQQDENVQAYCDFQNDKIYIDARLPDAAWADTIFHEVAHFISFIHDLGLTESQASTIGNGYFSSGFRLPGVRIR
jgi:hypothetical protein